MVTPKGEIKPAAAPEIDEEAIERAERALKSMANDFESWIDEEVNLLTAARDTLRANGISQPAINMLSHRAHDLKGQGATLNFPFVTKVAEQLCRICEHLPSSEDLPLALVEAHVDAIRAIVRDGLRGDSDATGIAIVSELSTRVGETLAHWRQRAT